MDEQGNARIDDVVDSFSDYYEDRKERGLPLEKSSGIFLTKNYSRKQVEQLMLSMPFKVYEEMGVMSHSKYIGMIQLDKHIAKRLNDEDFETIRDACRNGLRKYYGAF